MDTAAERENTSFSRMWFVLPVPLLVLAGRPPSAQETALVELTRTIALSRSGDVFTKKLTGVVTNARVKSLAPAACRGNGSRRRDRLWPRQAG